VSHVFEIVLPVFGICLLGYLSISIHLLGSATGDALARYVFVIAVPMLLFRSMAIGDFDVHSALQLWTAYFGGVGVTWLAAFLLIRLVFKRGYKASVIAGIAASFSNTVLVGIPLVQQAFGNEMLQVMLLIVTIHLPVMFLVSSFLVEYAAYADDPAHGFEPVKIVGRVAANLATNAIVIAIVAGALWQMTGIPLAGPFGKIVETFAATAGPLALFSLGMSLHKYGIAQNFKQASLITVMSLVLFPVAVLAIGMLLPGLPRDWVRVAVVTAACPTGVNAYLFATHFKTAEGLSTNVIMMSTAFAAVTISVWLAIANAL
jgi:malonate transporter